MGTYSVKYGSKSLEDENNSNKIILKGLFMKVKGDFPRLDVQNGPGSFASDNPLPLSSKFVTKKINRSHPELVRFPCFSYLFQCSLMLLKTLSNNLDSTRVLIGLTALYKRMW